METDGVELRTKGRERMLAGLRSLERKFKKKKQRRKGQHYILEIQDTVHGTKTKH